MATNRPLSARLNRLFDVMHKASAPAISNTAAAAAITRQSDVQISSEKLGQLRAGTKREATSQQLSAIAEFFGVPAHYLLDPEDDETIDSELTLLEALRDAGVRGLHLCGAEPLTPQATVQLAELITRLPA